MINKYTNGLEMEQFERIVGVSFYNHNYYIGFDNDLLYAESDDDNTTEWYLILGRNGIGIGYSLISEGEKLILAKFPLT